MEHPYYLIGRYFGYPECCLTDMAGLIQRKTSTIYDGTGYKPCEACAKRPMEDVLKEIAERRACPTPFPDDSGFDEILTP